MNKAPSSHPHTSPLKLKRIATVGHSGFPSGSRIFPPFPERGSRTNPTGQVSPVVCEPSAKRVRASRGECSRYRSYLHKAIVFPLLRTRLPRTWRGCHSALGPLSSAFSHISRGSDASLYLPRRSSFPPLFVLPTFLRFCAPSLFRPSSFVRFQTSLQRRRPYTLSSLPCLHSCIQLHGATLMHFVRNVLLHGPLGAFEK